MTSTKLISTEQPDGGDSTDTRRIGNAVEMSPSFVALDWGTSSFRMWSLSLNGEVIDRATGPFGMAGFDRSEFGTVLEEKLGSLQAAHSDG